MCITLSLRRKRSVPYHKHPVHPSRRSRQRCPWADGIRLEAAYVPITPAPLPTCPGHMAIHWPQEQSPQRSPTPRRVSPRRPGITRASGSQACTLLPHSEEQGLC